MLGRGAFVALLTGCFGMAACGSDEASEAHGSRGATGGAGPTTGSSTSAGITEACAEAIIMPEQVPLTMFIMFDKSGSMLDDQKWAGSKAALIAFFQDCLLYTSPSPRDS